jgi:HSP20 family molecular chaperone IbpA
LHSWQAIKSFLKGVPEWAFRTRKIKFLDLSNYTKPQRMSISPFLRDLIDLQVPSDLVFDVAFDVPGVPFEAPTRRREQPQAREGRGGWRPAVDIKEEEHHVVIEVELPGMKKEDIDIHFAKDTLEVSGKRERKTEGITSIAFFLTGQARSGSRKRALSALSSGLSLFRGTSMLPRSRRSSPMGS